MKSHTVKAGDCFASIAKENGFHDADILYSHGSNASLKSKRPNLHTLAVGDEVKVPDKELKTVSIGLEKTSEFEVKGLVTKLLVIIEDFEGSAMSDKEYELSIGPQKHTGKTDGTGKIEVLVDAQATNGTVIIYLDDLKKNSIRWPLELGHLSHYEELEGVQARLQNLGYTCGNTDGTMDDLTKQAIQAFKVNNGLADDDVLDQATKDKLLAVYGL